MKKRSFVLHPFFFAIYPMLFFYSHNIKELTLNVVFLPMAIILGLCLILWFILLLFKNQGGIVLSLFFIIFFSYGHLSRLFFGEVVPLFFSVVYLLVFLALTVGVFKLKGDLIKFTSILNIISIALVIFSVYNITYYELKYRVKVSLPDQSLSSDFFKSKKTELANIQNFPDIYYIIFDRYGSSEVLSEFFDFDNSAFETDLEKRGFYVASRSRTNYPYSYLSLASSLNLYYLDFLYEKTGKTNDKTIAYQLLKKTRAVQFLKSLGYKYYHLGMWWEPTRINTLADENFLHKSFETSSFKLDEFSSKLLQTTLLDFFIQKFSPDKTRKGRGGAQIVLYQFNQLEKIPLMSGPKFVFAHILITHPPYFFDKDGKILPHEVKKKKKEKELYLNSIQFANKKILHLVDKLISDSARPPLIILQADEGPRSRLIKSVEELKKADRRLRLRTGILNTLYLPGADQKLLHKDMSPVNTFRLIFNIYFGTSFNILEDKSFISQSRKNLYKFKDITKIIHVGTVVVRSKPGRARIYLDGKYLEIKTPKTLRGIQPGTHTLKLTKRLHEDYEITFQIKAGETKTIDAIIILRSEKKAWVSSQ